MVTLRGRRASPIRPGLITKQVLLGEVPLATGELTNEAAIIDLYNAYRAVLKSVNELRPRDKRIKGMSMKSYYTMFKFAQLLGLVVLVREEPMVFPPPSGALYRVEKPDGVHVVTATRKIFTLTDIGREDERSWSNLTTAWKEQWPAPQKVEVPIVPLVPPRPPKPPVVPPVTFTPYKWSPTISIVRVKSLARHLETLETIGIDKPEVEDEVDRLSMRIGDWVIAIEDAIEDARALGATEVVERHRERLALVTHVSEGLMDRDLRRAINALQELSK